MVRGKIIQIDGERRYILAFLLAVSAIAAARTPAQILQALELVDTPGPYDLWGLQAFAVEIVSGKSKRKPAYTISAEDAARFAGAPMRWCKPLLAALGRRDVSEDHIRRALRIADKYKSAHAAPK